MINCVSSYPINSIPLQLTILICILVQVKFEQGIKILKIFKEHSSKTCILDDFGFYEDREKMIQERKSKEQLLQKQVVCKHLDEKSPHLTCYFKHFQPYIPICML